ncbi:unnamed protein product, partial [Vitis vinifera]|uniref:Uncharacterized protein n=1 Tax=Vitis vinifera TaxID=29760 RepID=D7TY43_VITVI
MNGEDWIWSFGKSLEGKRRREKNSGFLHHAQISSNVRCRFFHGPIELKFGGEVYKSLILNLKGTTFARLCLSWSWCLLWCPRNLKIIDKDITFIDMMLPLNCHCLYNLVVATVTWCHRVVKFIFQSPITPSALEHIS